MTMTLTKENIFQDSIFQDSIFKGNILNQNWKHNNVKNYNFPTKIIATDINNKDLPEEPENIKVNFFARKFLKLNVIEYSIIFILSFFIFSAIHESIIQEEKILKLKQTIESNNKIIEDLNIKIDKAFGH